MLWVSIGEGVMHLDIRSLEHFSAMRIFRFLPYWVALCAVVSEGGLLGFHKWFVGRFPGAVSRHTLPARWDATSSQRLPYDQHDYDERDISSVARKGRLRRRSRYWEVDHVLFDMNQILHTCCRNASTESKALRILFRILDSTLAVLRPSQSIVLAIDGSAPVAKLGTQLRRRLKYWKENFPKSFLNYDTGVQANQTAEGRETNSDKDVSYIPAWRNEQSMAYRSLERANYSPTEANTGRARNETPPEKSEKHSKKKSLDPALLTPGTHFMDTVHTACQYYIYSRLSQKKHLSNNLRAYLSGPQSAGEGELKLIDWTNKHLYSSLHENDHVKSGFTDRARDNISRVPGDGDNSGEYPLHPKGHRTSVVTVGGDSDILLQGLSLRQGPEWFVYNPQVDRMSDAHQASATPSARGSSCREPKNGGNVAEGAKFAQNEYPGGNSENGVGKKRQKLIYSLSDLKRTFRELIPDYEDKMRYDFIFLCLLNGNDYLPKLGGFGFEKFFSAYVATRRRYQHRLRNRTIFDYSPIATDNTSIPPKRSHSTIGAASMRSSIPPRREDEFSPKSEKLNPSCVKIDWEFMSLFLKVLDESFAFESLAKHMDFQKEVGEAPPAPLGVLNTLLSQGEVTVCEWEFSPLLEERPYSHSLGSQMHGPNNYNVGDEFLSSMWTATVKIGGSNFAGRGETKRGAQHAAAAAFLESHYPHISWKKIPSPSRRAPNSPEVGCNREGGNSGAHNYGEEIEGFPERCEFIDPQLFSKLQNFISKEVRNVWGFGRSGLEALRSVEFTRTYRHMESGEKPYQTSSLAADVPHITTLSEVAPSEILAPSGKERNFISERPSTPLTPPSSPPEVVKPSGPVLDGLMNPLQALNNLSVLIQNGLSKLSVPREKGKARMTAGGLYSKDDISEQSGARAQAGDGTCSKKQAEERMARENGELRKGKFTEESFQSFNKEAVPHFHFHYEFPESEQGSFSHCVLNVDFAPPVRIETGLKKAVAFSAQNSIKTQHSTRTLSLRTPSSLGPFASKQEAKHTAALQLLKLLAPGSRYMKTVTRKKEEIAEIWGMRRSVVRWLVSSKRGAPDAMEGVNMKEVEKEQINQKEPNYQGGGGFQPSENSPHERNAQWKYNDYKFDPDKHNQSQFPIVSDYLTGIVWNMLMYIKGACPNLWWSFAHPHGPSPFSLKHFIDSGHFRHMNWSAKVGRSSIAAIPAKLTGHILAPSLVARPPALPTDMKFLDTHNRPAIEHIEEATRKMTSNVPIKSYWDVFHFSDHAAPPPEPPLPGFGPINPTRRVGYYREGIFEGNGIYKEIGWESCDESPQRSSANTPPSNLGRSWSSRNQRRLPFVQPRHYPTLAHWGSPPKDTSSVQLSQGSSQPESPSTGPSHMDTNGLGLQAGPPMRTNGNWLAKCVGEPHDIRRNPMSLRRSCNFAKSALPPQHKTQAPASPNFHRYYKFVKARVTKV